MNNLLLFLDAMIEFISEVFRFSESLKRITIGLIQMGWPHLVAYE
tara:strand:- start:1397 stop:1531 length:135 start_codon:yes stop_codon:yes gene_type:complete